MFREETDCIPPRMTGLMRPIRLVFRQQQASSLEMTPGMIKWKPHVVIHNFASILCGKEKNLPNSASQLPALYSVSFFLRSHSVSLGLSTTNKKLFVVTISKNVKPSAKLCRDEQQHYALADGQFFGPKPGVPRTRISRSQGHHVLQISYLGCCD